MIARLMKMAKGKSGGLSEIEDGGGTRDDYQKLACLIWATKDIVTCCKTTDLANRQIYTNICMDPKS